MKRLARRLHRRFRSKKSTRGRKHSGRTPRLENLEPRQMLAADGLAFAQSALFLPDTLNTIPFVVEGNVGQPVAISFHVHATDGQLDPATPEVRTESGVLVPAIHSVHDYQGTSDSLLIVELAAGIYQIGVGGELGTTGSFDVHAGLPGDSSGNGQVSKSELQHVTAAVVQSKFGFTNVSAQVFKKLGIDVSKNLYRSEHDVNGNGKIDSFDQSVIEASVGAPAIQLEFMLDDDAPVLSAMMVGDTGRSSTDGITNNLNATINGTVSDEMPIVSFTASVDGATAVELGGLLGQDFSGGGSFSISRLQLEQAAGNVTVTNNGSHTLVLTARDQQGNSSTQQLTFEFDTVAPAAPTALDLDASSDSGSSNSDNNTNQQQLLIHADAEDNAIVQFFSSLVNGSIGQDTANSPVSTTTSTLPEGTQNITATSTDVAGNTSGPSDPLSVTVDITSPTAPEFFLHEDFDTGEDGDHLTTIAPVVFVGSTGANAAVELRRGGQVVASGMANAEGDFEFDNVVLPFGASSYQVVATDAAGNSSTSTSQSFTRNDAPVVEDQGLEVAENRPVGFVVGTAVATDANLGEGDSLTYEIIGGSGASVFAINASSGEITVVDPDALDFETTTQFELTVRVTDHGGNGSGTPGTGLSDTATVTISLNDLNEAPVVDDQGFEIDENSPSDELVGIVVADDLDEGDSFTFAITAGNTDGAFVIDPETGEIRVANSEALDFETVPDHTFSLTVTVTDTEMLTGTATITITLDDINDRPTAEDQAFDVSVKYPDGTVVGTVVAEDQDVDDSLTYALYALMDGEFPEGAFSIGEDTGEISVFNADELDDGISYTLMVQVMDEDEATLITPITITLNAVANLPPTAVDDDAATNEDSFIDIMVFDDNGHGTDSDPDDPLVIDSVDATSALGATITQEADGTLRYDPSSIMDNLSEGQVVEDTFTYTIKDAGEETSTATVTVSVSGVNEDPTAEDDVLATTEDTPLTFDPLADHGNGVDSDPDMNDVLSVSEFDAVSANGATITFMDGMFTYDPSTSATLQALLEGDDPIVDTFQYAISDGHAGTATATVSVTVSGLFDPSFLTIEDQEVYAGAPLIIPLNGVSPYDNPLTFTAMSDDGELLEPIVYSTGRSLSITVAGYGEMRFYLFEELVQGVTQPIIDLVESGILDGTIFHRLIQGFVVQGLDPTGTGLGHPGLLDFDDQYHADLQHTGSGYLSMAKGGDDSNSSQIFITDVDPIANANSYTLLRRLDFNHSVFGRLTIGEDIRQQIMMVGVDADDKPNEDLVIEDIRIITDEVNAVLMLKAPNDVTGTTSVMVTVSDPEGNEYSQSFDVTVAEDPFNGVPFLSGYPTDVVTTIDTDVEIPLEAFDDEGDPVAFAALEVGLETKILFDNGGAEMDVTAPGTTDFSFRGSNWTGGEVATDVDTALFSSGSHGYAFGSEGEVTFDVPVLGVEFYFVHQSGEDQQTATAYDADENVIATWDSFEATEYNDPDHFISQNFGTAITRIEFSGGNVDNFYFRNQTVGLTFDVDQDTGVVTVTPPAGFTGTMAILIGLSQSGSTPDTVDGFDRQVIPITVLPLDMLTAAEGGSGQAATSIGADDPLLTQVLQSALATWQTALGVSQLPDIQLNVADLGDARLGSAATVAANGVGLPASSVITIDDDGAGRGWHTSVDQAVAADRYDLYTVLLHEVGHALGFHQAAARLSSPNSDSLALSDQALEAYFDDFGHVSDDDDLMSDELPLGMRRVPSALDVEILQLAYGLATGDS